MTKMEESRGSPPDDLAGGRRVNRWNNLRVRHAPVLELVPYNNY
jgi:hypothetical protein